jgi:dihydroxy-acid dehydratase
VDTTLVILALLLAASLAAFASGALPYPIGSIILVAFLAARILYIKGKK